MPIQVSVDDEILEFPDDMSDDDIQSVLRKEYPSGPSISEIAQRPSFQVPSFPGIQSGAMPELSQPVFDIPESIAGERSVLSSPDVMDSVSAVTTPVDYLTAARARAEREGIEFLRPMSEVIAEKVAQASLTGEEMQALGLPGWLAPIERGIAQTAGGLVDPESAPYMASPAFGAKVAAPIAAAFIGQMGAQSGYDIAAGAGKAAGGLTDEGLEQLARGGAGAAIIGGPPLIARAVTPTPRQAAIRQLRAGLEAEPALPIPAELQPTSIRELGIPREALTAEPFLQPGVGELASAALREAQGPRIEIPGELSALETLRREIEPPRVELAEPTRLAERIPGSGEAPYGKTSFRREAEAPTAERTQRAMRDQPMREMRPIEPGRGEEINAPNIEDVRAQRALEQRALEQRQGAKSKSQVGDEDLSVVVQSPQKLGAETMKGYVQVDSVRGGKNEWSSNPDALIAGGYDVPTTAMLQTLPQGKYTMPQAKQMLKEKAVAELEPAVMIGGTPKTGRSHMEIALKEGTPEALQAMGQYKNQGFVYGGKFLSREAASKLIGEKEPLTSERLGEIRSKKGAPLEKAKEEVLTEAPDLVTRLEALKFSEAGEGRLYSLPHPDAIAAIGRSTWNSAVDVAIASVKAGKAVKEAIEDAISYLKKNAKSFDEAQARANIEYITRQETGGSPPASPPPATATPAAPVPKGTTLDDVYQRFEPVKKTSTPLKETGAKIVEAVRTGMASKFRPIDKLAEDIGKAYGISMPSKISGIFEQLKGSTGKGEADIYRFDRDVSKLVKGSEKDFNAYMFLRRTLDRLSQDLADIQTAQAGGKVYKLNRRKVSGYTIPEIEGKLRLLENNLGSEKVQQFQNAAEKYQSYMDSSLRFQVESGRMSPEVYSAIKEGNQFYAPFKVMKYFEEVARPEGTGKKIDTAADYTKAMEGIEDPNFRLGDMLGAARQNILLSRILADKNMAMRKIAQLADFDPDGLFIKRLKSGQEAPEGLSLVNVKEGGKDVKYAVNKDVAEAIQSMGPMSENILIQMMGYAAIPMKAGATSLNIPFQVSNLAADVPRQALVSRYGLNSASDLIRYPIDFVRAAYSSISGDVFKSDNKAFLDFLDSGAAGGTVQEFLTPSALRFRPSGLEKTSKDFAKSVLFTLPDFARAVEQTSKVMGVQRAMRFHGVESGKELASIFPEAITEIRRFSGSPDFGRQGKWVEQARLNLIYMFFNARLQGTLADIGRLAGRDGPRTTALAWTRLSAAIGAPTLYLYALNHSQEYREDYLKRPEQERQNYWLIPKDTFITNEQGERLRDYWRIPKRESAKWLANFTESALNFYNQRNPEQLGQWMEAMLTDVSPVNIQGDTMTERMESMAASLNPVMKAPIEMATGRDLYRHRDIVPESMQKASPEQQYIERTPEVFRSLAEAIPDVAPEVFRSPMMLENMVKNFTAGMVTQFLPRKALEGRSGLENNPLLQRFQAVPYTDSSDFENKMKFLEREAADVQIERYRNARAILDANKGKPINGAIKQAVEKFGPDERMLNRIVDLYIAEQRGINSEERRILALPTQQRAQFIADELRGATPEQKAQIIRKYAEKRILTEQVGAELGNLLKP
jgi:Large polyvalent protein associated domain 38